ncbi:hypothetical protein ACLB2K_055964 [Fragaria x ananassa]
MNKGLYCYVAMPFGLKNAGATYQRLVTEMFAKHLGSIIEVYVNDMLVKSLKAEDHVGNLKTIFLILLEYGMRLNSKKCFLGITSSKFLGYIVSEQGVEANLTKIKAVLDM